MGIFKTLIVAITGQAVIEASLQTLKRLEIELEQEKCLKRIRRTINISKKSFARFEKWEKQQEIEEERLQELARIEEEESRK